MYLYNVFMTFLYTISYVYLRSVRRYYLSNALYDLMVTGSLYGFVLLLIILSSRGYFFFRFCAYFTFLCNPRDDETLQKSRNTENSLCTVTYGRSREFDDRQKFQIIIYLIRGKSNYNPEGGCFTLNR